MRRASLALVVLLAMASPAAAGERIDLFDARGRRTGYAIVDRATGRVDFYDTQSRRTGYGKIDSTGRTERFGLKGRRPDPTLAPVLPELRR